MFSLFNLLNKNLNKININFLRHFNYFINYNNYTKKAQTEIPFVLLIQMMVGILIFILVLIPIYQMFQTSDYNRDVANDLSQGVVDFVDFVNARTQSTQLQCREELKLHYLSNSQILNSNYDNYVIVITPDKTGLITYEDFQKLKSNEIDSNFDSFDDKLFSQRINLKLFNIGQNVEDLGQIELIFLVPSAVFERNFLFRTGSIFNFVDSKAGYHVFYLQRDEGSLIVRPGDNYFSDLLTWESGTNIFQINTYSLGFVSFQGNYLAVQRINRGEFNFLNNCNSPPPIFDPNPNSSNSNINTKGIMCTAIIDFHNEELENQRIRNNIYWSDGYQCASEFLGERNFCQELRQNNQTSFIFQADINSNREEIKNSYIRFCGEFYSSLFSQDEASLEIIIDDLEEEDRFVTNNRFNFLDFFQKIPDETIINYINQNREENYFFSRDNVPHNWVCSISNTQIDLNGNSPCNYIIRYLTQNSQGITQSRYAFYIHTQDPQYRGFYVVKDEESFILHRNLNQNLEFRLGDRILPFSSQTLMQLDCGWFTWLNPFASCEYQEIIELQINEYLFDDILHPNFQVYLNPIVVSPNRRTTGTLEHSLTTFFREVNDYNKGGLNNEEVEINNQMYIINTDFLAPEIVSINPDFAYIGTSRINSISVEFNMINFNTRLLYILNDQSRNRNMLNFDLQREDISLELEIPFEQLLHSMYNSQELESTRVREEINSLNMVLVPHTADELNYVFYLRTINTNRPVFEEVINSRGNLIYIPAMLTLNTRFIEEEILEQENESTIRTFIFPLLKENGDIEFERIEKEITFDDFNDIVINSNIDDYLR
ncbi:MAG: hypothetical protein LAT82_02660 [Nanoarchaeota archaeon]|nr:hypothetical protein [Nanoarchaeota archaeon]